MSSIIPRNILSTLLMLFFTIVSITGIMMYFKIRIFSSEVLHIWLGFACVALVCLHVVKNWSAFSSYFKRRSTFGAILFGVFVVLAFVIPPLFNSHKKEVNPKGTIIKTMMSAPLSKVVAFVDLDMDKTLKGLMDKQISATREQSITQIAKANNKTNDEILKIVFSASNP